MSGVAVIGCGNMGRALIGGLGATESFESVVGVVSDPESVVSLQNEFQDVESISFISREGELPAEITSFVLAVKPKDIEEAISDWRGAIGRAGDDAVVVSIAAGTEAEQIRASLPDEASLVRGMPNTPAKVGAGVTGIWSQSEMALARAERIFSAVGEVVRLDKESDFDALTAVSGSGPAYVFLAIEALADGGVAEGLDRQTAMTLAVETLRGASELAAESGEHPGQLKDAVTSPGGTTAAGLRSLERDGFRSAWIQAVRAAAERGRQMGGEDE